MTQLVRIATRQAPGSFAQDLLGGLALVVIVFGGLMLPALL
jgi:hypothetical protein